jgi:hypothetical protein
MNLGAFFAASNPKTPQKTGLSASIPQHQHPTLAGFPLLSLARFRIHDKRPIKKPGQTLFFHYIQGGKRKNHTRPDAPFWPPGIALPVNHQPAAPGRRRLLFCQ